MIYRPKTHNSERPPLLRSTARKAARRAVPSATAVTRRLADCDQETNIQQYALGPTVSKTHLCHTL